MVIGERDCLNHGINNAVAYQALALSSGTPRIGLPANSKAMQLDPRLPQNWPALAKDEANKAVRLALRFSTTDHEPTELDISETDICLNSRLLSTGEGRIRLANAWDEALSRFWINEPQNRPSLDLEWWSKNVVLASVRPFIRTSQKTRLEWTFSSGCEPADTELEEMGCPLSNLRSYHDKPLRGRPIMGVTETHTDPRGVVFSITDAWELGNFDEDDKEPMDPRQYECICDVTQEYGWEYVLAVQEHPGSSVSPRDEFNKLEGRYEFLYSELSQSLETLFKEHKVSVSDLAAQVKSMPEYDRSEESPAGTAWPYTNLVKAEKPVHRFRIISPSHESASLVLGIQKPDEEIYEELFCINRLVNVPGAARRRDEQRRNRSNVEHRLAEALTRQGYLVAIEPKVAFPSSEVRTWREPDLLVFCGGRALAVEIDDKSHIFGTESQSSSEKWQRDRDLDKLMLIHGIPIFRVSHRTALTKPADVVSDVCQIFDALGGSRLRHI
jgi:hypothetical protein